MKIQYYLLAFVLVILASSIPQRIFAATLTNGMNASDLIGQYSDIGGTTPNYTKSGANNGPNALGFNSPDGIVVDTVYHRLFVADGSNNRVLEYNLDSSNHLISKVPDHVLGQIDFNSTTVNNNQWGLNGAFALAFDPSTDRLFVGEPFGNRIKVFDLTSGITNGMNASYVIGQVDFTGASATVRSSGLSAVNLGLAFDQATERLFVAEPTAHRVKIFNVATSTISNGMNAINILGQSTYTGSGAANSQSGLNGPSGLAFDPATERLFVSEGNAARIKVFNVATSTIVDDENADHVLGQTTFSGSGSANSQSGLNGPRGIAFDPSTNRLFVSELGGNRVKVFDVATSTISDGENATHVLGQVDFSGASVANTQSGLNNSYQISFDPSNNLIYVGELSGNRIKIFNVSTSTISDGENASDLIGQYIDNTGATVSYTKSGANNGPNALGLSSPTDVLVDATNHRLFVADRSNKRILEYNLDTSNHLIDKIPDHVLGQADFNSSVATTTQSGFSQNSGLAFDAATNRLFVTDDGNRRVLVFDLSSGITDGMNAVHVIGQAVFTTSGAGNTQSTLTSPQYIAFDPTTERLFVSEFGGSRVKVFDVATSTIVDGENATNVIGQADFTSSGTANTQTGINFSNNIAFDPATERLFISEFSGNRVKIFNVATSTILATSTAAINVIGQSNYSGFAAADTQSGLRAPTGVTVDSADNLLFVAETNGNRIKIFNIATSTIMDGENALNVLGQTTFSGASANNTQSGLNNPAGITFDTTTNYLYVTEQSGNRIKIFDLSPSSSGGCSTTNVYNADGSITTNKCGVITTTPPTTSGGISGGSTSSSSGSSAVTTSVVSPTTTSANSVVCPQGDVFSTTTGQRCTVFVTFLTLPTVSSSYTFTRDLTLGSTGADVAYLQRYLNSHRFTVSQSGAGSPGDESSYFGAKTKTALTKFQNAHNITPGIGYFGPITRGVVNAAI